MYKGFDDILNFKRYTNTEDYARSSRKLILSWVNDNALENIRNYEDISEYIGREKID